MHKKAIKIALCAVLIAKPAAACDDLFTIDRVEQGQDGNTAHVLTLTEWTRENLTDSTINQLGRCFLSLMESAPGMSAVVADGRHFSFSDAKEMIDF